MGILDGRKILVVEDEMLVMMRHLKIWDVRQSFRLPA